ncbi:ATP-binding protein [Halomonas koreensis]|uniref:histidine kinase n=1 Tax=Halomonas koreensis TaxID=245385 RepID=A0ABU1G1X8_9GAMM|nr:ATP-binding protein [Halomonas koreensis]MDR5866889.1 response regulator [Halomonas koreensis]
MQPPDSPDMAPTGDGLEGVTRLARELLAVPMALLARVDRRGSPRVLAVDGAPSREALAFCARVADAATPLAAETAGGLAGHPLCPDGAGPTGALCVAGVLDARARRRLALLASQAEALLRAREQAHRLERSTRRLEAILRESATGILRIDADGIVLDANPYALLLLGYAREELLGHNVNRLMPEAVAREHDGYLRRFLAGGTPRIIGQGREVEARHRDGHPVPVHLAVSALRDETGRIDEFIGILTDLSEIRAAREAALRERQLLRAVLDGSHDPIYARSGDGRYLAINQAFDALLPHRDGDDALSGLAADVRDGIEAAERRVLADGRPQRLALSLRPGRHHDLTLAPLREVDGSIDGVVGVAHDNSQTRRQAALLRVLHQGITDYQALMSGHRLWTFLMEALRELTESDYALIGEVIEEAGAPALKIHAITDLSWSEESRRLMERLRSGDMTLTDPDTLLGRVFAHGEVVMTEDLAGHPHRGGMPPGHPALHNYLGVPIHDGDALIGMYAIANGRRAYDDSLLEWLRPFTATCALLINLYRRMAERESVLEALARARDEAQRASQAKSDFLSAMSHELRTPLNAILGFSQLLAGSRRHPLDARQRRQVEQIDKSGRHLLRLIDDILDLARIEAGRLPLSRERVDLGEVAEDALEALETQAREREVRLAADLVAEATVEGDYTRLKQVLLNLLSNAIKYNRPGGEVHLAIERRGDAWRIGVRDTGPGIPEGRRGELFQPFQRLDAEHGPVEGTGIGLAITRELVEHMGGRLEVASRPGEGSHFWFTLPATAPAAPPAAAPTSAPAAEVRARVLYVEDNPANRRLMAEAFEEREGLSLQLATSAEQALELIRRRPPDLVLMDLHLPGMDGFEALARLRAVPSLRHLPVLALSANAMRDDVRRGREAGFDDYLVKPVAFDDLFAALARCLATPENA